ncbi:MAG: type 2 periplasmic-binding domain-containing protein, partial [Thermomicrobiales bacterium]
FALSHTYWVTLNSVGRQAWLQMSGGKIFADDATRFKALCAGTWKMDTPWNRKAAEVTKQLFQYWPPGSTTLQAADIEQLFLSQKAALWQGTPGNQGQTILKRVDEAKAEGLETFEVGAFPTPQPDAETFGADIAKNAAPIADDGERGLGYQVAIPDIRQDKDPGAEAISIDFLQWMTTPEIQAIYVKPSYDLPINPNVKLDDPRLQLFYKNKNQLFPAWWFYGNRPDWIPNFQAYLLGKKDLDTYIKDQQTEILNWTQQTIRQSKLDIPCG